MFFVNLRSYLFVSSYCLAPWVVPPHGSTNHGLNPPLKSGGSLEIGFGTSAAGYPPRTFPIKSNSDIDVGFLKIYLSTESVDLSYLPQDSPFSSTRSITPYVFKSGPHWNGIVIPMIVRRRQTTFMGRRN
jgi:hypothetical protein